VDYPFIPSPNVTRTEGRPIHVVVIHTMETSERGDAAEAVARWFARPETAVSAHYCVDADSVVQCVREEDVAWHARGGNASSIGIELAGTPGRARRGGTTTTAGLSWSGRRRSRRTSARGTRFRCAGCAPRACGAEIAG
jgi:hypothetical protein